ncbi:MAG: diaminopropionate ammonia-lyase [Candidatus Zixiibacteriota bacterium]|nr:MAG: diaminopropionate ammonia-lyase [candidate division Zixibacteria bacterium]
MCKYVNNPYRQIDPAWEKEDCAAFKRDDIRTVHQMLAEYQPTPLVALPALAERLGVGYILVKDESHRFGLKAFKALGSSYAIYQFLRDQLLASGTPLSKCEDVYRDQDVIEPGGFTFCTATDVNHGRGVAWSARKLRQNAVIYVPAETVPARIESIRAEGAEVIVTDGNYDDAVERAAEDAVKNGWQIISDNSWVGYVEIPRLIMAGYLTLFEEIEDALSGVKRPEVVIIQGGVGALAAAAAWHFNQTGSTGIRLAAVEPVDADCLLASISSPGGIPTVSQGTQKSIMAGLNCGKPSLAAWPLIRSGFDMFMTISDDYCIKAMRSYYYPSGDDPRIISGESGAAGLGALMALCHEMSLAAARESLGLDSRSTVLLLNTEGDTDPVHFSKIIKEKP